MQVTVLMPAFNAERYISEAVESVLSQTYTDFEFIILNDGSTDNTLSIIRDYAKRDSRIRVIDQPNSGMGTALNKGMRLARGDLIVRMDADDVMLPNRIERQLDFMKANPDVAVASCLVYYINRQSRIIGRSTSNLRSRRDFEMYIKGGRLIGVSHPGVIMRKSVVLEVGGYRPQFWPADDIDLWMRIAERGHLIIVQQERLLKYRIHSGSISIAGAKMARLKVKWIQECIKARRTGKEEPCWEEFLRMQRERPLVNRLNESRKDWAKVLYKVSVHSYANGNYVKTLLFLLGASVMQHSYVLDRMRTRKIL